MHPGQNWVFKEYFYIFCMFIVIEKVLSESLLSTKYYA